MTFLTIFELVRRIPRRYYSRLEFERFLGGARLGRFYFYVRSFRAVAQSATEINDPGDETYFYRQPCRQEKLRLSCKYRSLARIGFRVSVALNRSLTSALSGRSPLKVQSSLMTRGLTR